MNRKRQLSSDNSDLGSPKLSKQSKLEDFFTTARETGSPPGNSQPSASPSNPAEDAAEDATNHHLTIDLSRFSPPTRSLIRALIDDQDQDQDFPSSQATGLVPASAALPLQQFNHVAGSLKQILQHLESIEMQLKEISTNCLGPLHQQGSLNHQPASSKPCKYQDHTSPPEPSTSPRLGPPPKLSLDPNSAVLSITFLQQHVPRWASLWQAKKHLSNILKINPSRIDLCKVDTLPSLPLQSRVILHFKSSFVPGLIFSHIPTFRELGISPQRLFKNTVISRLMRSTVDCHPALRESLASSPTSTSDVSPRAIIKHRSHTAWDPPLNMPKDLQPVNSSVPAPPRQPTMTLQSGPTNPIVTQAQVISAANSTQSSNRNPHLDAPLELPRVVSSDPFTPTQVIDPLDSVPLSEPPHEMRNVQPSSALHNGCILTDICLNTVSLDHST